MSSVENQKRILNVISILGLGGMGKTTLSQLVYKSSAVSETVLHQLRNNITGKRYLLVLDDVWSGEHRKWEQIFNSLRTGAAGSTILVTTRHEKVAKTMGSRYELLLGELSEEDSWFLFSEIAFFEKSMEQCEELEDVDRELARKCKGSPLVLKTIGSLMRFKTSLKYRQKVLSSEFWTLEETKKELLRPLMLSYYDFPLILSFLIIV